MKKILLICASVFLIFQSIFLVKYTVPRNIELWYLNLITSGLINLYITGIFAFAGFALPTQCLMPDRYYKVKNGSVLKRWYKLIRVDLFRKFLLATVWKNKEQHSKFFDGTRSGINNLVTQSKKSEFGHLIPFILITIICIYCVYLGKWQLALFTMIINVFFNYYPIVLQKYHRMRIQILSRRYEKV